MKNELNKKTIAIIVADENEINELPFELIKKNNSYIEYRHNGSKIIYTHCGIGLINAAMNTQKIILQHKPEIILNYGAVGGSKKTKLFDFIIPKRIYCHDVITPWYPLGQLPKEKKYYLNLYSNEKINISSGNKFIYEKESIENINKEYNSDIFDMETFGYAAVCEKNKIPFLTIKVVSDIIGETTTNKETINENINKAGKIALNHIVDLIKNNSI